MSGEKSKETGEYGEKIVTKLLKLMGWAFPLHPVDVPCHRTDLHRTPNNKDKKNHGLDFLYRYECPLCLDTQKTVSISAKYMDSYTKNPASKLKKFISELGNTMHCLTLDSELGKFKINKTIRNIEHVGLLVYLTHNDDFTQNLFESITPFRNTDKISYKPIYVIDNHIATFLYSSILDAKQYFSDDLIKFAYSNTEQNVGGIGMTSAGSLLPIEFVTSGLLPIQINNTNGKQLCLYVLDNFSKENFQSLFYFACKYTNGWATAITIKFFDYNERLHKNIVANVLSENQLEILSRKTIVEKFSIQDFKNLENN